MKLLLTLLITILAGCNLFNTEDEMLFVFNEMQCMEYEWEHSNDEAEWASNVKTYLEGEGITVNSIEGLDEHGVYCAACEICPTGRSIEVWVATEDSDLMYSLGFVEVE